MEVHHLHALRLGFSTHHAAQIASFGLEDYIQNQLKGYEKLDLPQFLKSSPKTLLDLKSIRDQANKNSKNLEKAAELLVKDSINLKGYILERIYNSPYPLKEKINLFFQNHFVVTLQGVKLPYWIYLHYQTLNQYVLGNYKELVKQMLYTNAMIRYLDNHQNRKGRFNENLARELLELFTLGEGHYTENDIKEVARALAGLSFGEKHGIYRPYLKDNSLKTIFGQTGNFDASDVVELIFKQPGVASHLVRKVLRWFFYNEPQEDLIKKYSKYLEAVDFELLPFFKNLFITECTKAIAGTKIKDPLTFLFQIHRDLNLTPNFKLMTFLLKNQGMDIYNQPNVKGWNGGEAWLSVQIYATRKQLADVFTNNNSYFKNRVLQKLKTIEIEELDLTPNLQLLQTDSATSILDELTDRLIFKTDSELRQALEQLLPYDFDNSSPNAKNVLLGVYNYLIKTPEFQIV